MRTDAAAYAGAVRGLASAERAAHAGAATAELNTPEDEVAGMRPPKELDKACWAELGNHTQLALPSAAYTTLTHADLEENCIYSYRVGNASPAPTMSKAIAELLRTYAESDMLNLMTDGKWSVEWMQFMPPQHLMP